MDLFKEFTKILDKVRLNNTFLALGFIVIIISFFIGSDMALRFGVITLVFGGILRVLNIVGSATPRQNHRLPSLSLYFANVFKCLLYVITLVVYLLLIDKIIILF